mmetsp:Transcript_80948/g.234663  ORF Transcript_80948/g.234663 Transcript_80948/m.234663 type:complete len:272 (+) Transcript_80948:146-961(+)
MLFLLPRQVAMLWSSTRLIRTWGKGPWWSRTVSVVGCWCSPQDPTGRNHASCAGGSITTRRVWSVAVQRLGQRRRPQHALGLVCAIRPSATPIRRRSSSAMSGRCWPASSLYRGQHVMACQLFASSSLAGRGSCGRMLPPGHCWSSPPWCRSGSPGSEERCSSSDWAAPRWRCGFDMRFPRRSCMPWICRLVSLLQRLASAWPQQAAATTQRLRICMSVTGAASWQSNRMAASMPSWSTHSMRMLLCRAVFARASSSKQLGRSYLQGARCP